MARDSSPFSLGSFREPLLVTRGFTTWEETFHYIQARDERIVLVIDEFFYLIWSNPAIPSMSQKGWDEHCSGSRLFLILLGSSMRMMENEVLGYRAPLYGRQTGQWRVAPMTFETASRFRQGKSFDGKSCRFPLMAES